MSAPIRKCRLCHRDAVPITLLGAPALCRKHLGTRMVVSRSGTLTVILRRGPLPDHTWGPEWWYRAQGRATALAELHSVLIDRSEPGVLLVDASDFYRDPPPLDHTDKRR